MPPPSTEQYANFRNEELTNEYLQPALLPNMIDFFEKHSGK
jgi:hypothetical protein